VARNARIDDQSGVMARSSVSGRSPTSRPAAKQDRDMTPAPAALALGRSAMASWSMALNGTCSDAMPAWRSKWMTSAAESPATP
jgi:hypothetical protein